MAFLDWFKSKTSKSAGSKPEVFKPSQIPVSVTPKAAMQQAPHANASANKAVVPKSIQPLNLSSRRTTAPLGLKSTGPIRLDESAVPATKPASSPALDPDSAVPEKHIELELGDFIDKVPAEMLTGGEVNRSEKISISSKQFASDLSRGKASISLATLRGIKPDIFTAEAASSDVSVPLPLRKIVSQIGEFKLREDQQSEEGPDHHFETPFLKGAIRDGADIPAPQSKPAAARPMEPSPPPAVSAPQVNPLKTSPPSISMPGGPLKISPTQAETPVQEKAVAHPPPFSSSSPGIKMSPLSGTTPPPAIRMDRPVAPTPSVNKTAPRPSGAQSLPGVPSQNEGDVQVRRRPPATVRATVAGGKIRISGKPGSSPPAVTPPAAKTSPSGLPTPGAPRLSPLAAKPPSIQLPPQPAPAAQESEPVPEAQPPVPEPAAAGPSLNVLPESSAPEESGPAVNIPLTMIIDSIPGAIVEGDLESLAKDTEVPVPLSLITPQLSRGSIKISIITLTALLPEQLKRIFNDVPSDEEIPLPLQYVLTHLPASAFAQRADQIDERPDVEIPTPFSQKAKEDAERLEEDEAARAEIPVEETSLDEVETEGLHAPAEELEPVAESEPEEEVEEAAADVTGEEGLVSGMDSAAVELESEPEPTEELSGEIHSPVEIERTALDEDVKETEAAPPVLPPVPASIFKSTSPDVRGRHVKPFISRRALRTIDAAEDASTKPLAPLMPSPLAPAKSASIQAPEKEEVSGSLASFRPSSADGMAQLQEIFMTDDVLDARAVAKLCASLPGVAAAVFSTRDGLHLAGGIDGLASVSALCALVPQAYDKTAKFSNDSTLGHATSFTICAGEDLFSIFGELDVFVVVKHDGRELKPGIRAKLQGVANGLSSIYAPSTGSGH